MKLKTIVTFLYLCISLIAFLSFDTTPIIWSSFFVNFLLITSIAYYHLNIEKAFSPFLTSFIIFNYLFFFLAPVFQISAMNDLNFRFPNDFAFNTSSVVFANLLILIFNIVFIFSYLYFKDKKLGKNKEQATEVNFKYNTPLAILVLLVACVAIAVFNYDYLLKDISESVYIIKDESTSLLLLKKKFLFFTPLGGIVLTLKHLQMTNKINSNTFFVVLSLVIFIVLLFFFKNIFTEKRNTLGPIYIALIYLFFPKLLNSNAKFFLFMFLSMVIIFPLSSTLTHIDASLEQIFVKPSLIYESFLRFGTISGAFESLHYDAFSNIMATVEYVKLYGLSWGYQLLGVCLFFVPRSLWTTKPLSTGELIGNHLFDTTPRNFTNLSNSVVSEGFINFGFIGIVVLAIVLAYFIVKFIIWHRSEDCLKQFIAFYFAVHLMFLLRGDLTNGFSYFIGPLLSVVFLPKLLIRFIK
jgi:hypothetical protein